MTRKPNYATCTICEATCGIEVTVEDGKVSELRGDERDPFSRGHVCPKAIGLRDLQNDPDRIRRPLRRGGAGFEEISWHEAYALAAEGVARAREAGGRDAVAMYRGTPTNHCAATMLGANVLGRALGTRNLFSAGPTDTWARWVQTTSMYGGPLRAAVPDVDRTDYFFIVGANPLVSNGSLMTAPGIRDRLAAVRKRGGKIVVVDPRRSETAKQADEHHFIVPGSDAAFLLSMVQVLFDERRISLGACAGWVNGLRDVERLTAAFAPDRVAPRCGIDADTIRRLAREFAEARSAAAYGRMGTCVQQFGTLSSWAIDLLAILTGNLDRPGGCMFAKPAAPLHAVFEAGGEIEFGRWKSRVSGSEEILGEFPASVLSEEIETPGEGQIRALVTVAGNPIRTYPNTLRLERAVESLDFMLSFDFYLNETTRHADLILPPPGPLERWHYDLGLNHFAVRNVAKWSPAVFEPEDDSRDAWTTCLELARRWMGLESLELAQFDGIVLQQFAALALATSDGEGEVSAEEAIAAVGETPGCERIVDLMLRAGPYGDGFGARPEGLSLARVQQEKHGMDLGPLVPMLPDHIATRSGQIELAPERLVSDLPRLERWLATGAEQGLRLINRRDIRSMNSWLHNLPALAKGRDRCTLQIHPDDAAARGLGSGERARIRTRVGEVEAPVEVTTDVMPGVVSLPHGFGHTGGGLSLDVATVQPGVNVNAVTDDALIDEVSGASVLFGGPVEVVRA